jgi:hypothetical protein
MTDDSVDPVEAWRQRRIKWREEQRADYARRHPDEAADFDGRVRAVLAPLLEQWTADVIVPELREMEQRILRETRSLKRRSRLRRWDAKEIQRYAQKHVASLPKAPQT